MTVSIIIAVKIWQKRLEECVSKLGELDYPDFEVIVAFDYDNLPKPQPLLRNNTVRFVPIFTGNVSPAKKRDLALPYAKGEILAFIDDDAYPQEDWLKNALKHFVDVDVAAVGGPAITPATDTLRQKASGEIFSSFLVSGSYVYRYLPQKKREVDDYPSCNFLVRRSIMEELGGFNTDFWPGEDTKLCLDITKKLKKKIIYDPKVLVYHHRRQLFLPHLKQVANYALHRGYFVKHFPETSRRLSYFIPSIFLLFIISSIFSFYFIPVFKTMYIPVLSLYIFLVAISSIKRDIRLIPLVSLGIISTHLTYGFYFIRGLSSSKIK